MKTDIPIILASQSPRRRELLSRIGIDPIIMPSTITEKINTDDPAEAVKLLSRQKAENVAAKLESCYLVIGADTVVAADGKILGKPKTHEEAAEMICRIEGKTHHVYTGVTLMMSDESVPPVTFADETAVHVYSMTADEIAAYASSDEPMDKAGAYAIQGAFSAYIKGIEGDYANVVGLPVGALYQALKAFISKAEKEV
jgi:septum formation protein